jgi:hypothetical protein
VGEQAQVGQHADFSWGRAVLTIALFSVATPLSFWAVNAPRGAAGSGLMGLAVAVLGLGLALLLGLSRFFTRGRATALSVVAVLALLNWRLLGGPVRAIPGLGSLDLDLAPLATVGILGWLAWRFGDRREFQLPALAMGLVMAVSPLPALVSWYAGPSESAGGAEVEIDPWAGGSGDVYIIVLDGYGRADVLSEIYGISVSDTVDRLQEAGFIVPPYAHANYSSTVASLASALLMSHVGTVGERPTDRERVALHRVIGGSSPVVAAFKASGYRYVHVESGWDGARCGDVVDTCRRALLPDETMWALLERSALARIAEYRYGHAFTLNGLRALDDLVALEGDPDPQPRFVFAHVVLPHPPLFADAGCGIRFVRELGGGAMSAVGIDERLLSKREAAYGEQVSCVNRRLVEFAGLLDPEDIVIVTGDHGPDSFVQLSLNPTEWSADAIWERMSVFAAVRMPGCEDRVSDAWSVVDGLRVLVECLSGRRLPAPADGLFVYPVDASPGVVAELEGEVMR